MNDMLTYGDVLIAPRYSDIETRADIDVQQLILGNFRYPIISAPMDTVSGPHMVTALYESDAYGILHRFGADWDLWADVEKARNLNENATFGISIGVKDFDKTKVWLDSVAYLGIHSVCIDVAHGHHKMVLDTIYSLKKYMSDSGYSWHIIAGNVGSAEGYAALADAGADAVRVGIGPGSACTTRETTGVGVPQLSLVSAVSSYKNFYGYNTLVIADGGIQNPGDIAKALAAGADAVMLGKMLAGADESLAPVAQGYKWYRGQSLVGSNGARGAPEGVEGRIPSTGPVSKTIETLMHYLRSSLSYVGARNLKEFREKVEFIRVSPATQLESNTRLGV